MHLSPSNSELRTVKTNILSILHVNGLENLEKGTENNFLSN